MKIFFLLFFFLLYLNSFQSQRQSCSCPLCSHTFEELYLFFIFKKTSSFRFFDISTTSLPLPLFAIFLLSLAPLLPHSRILRMVKKESDRSIMYNNNEHIETTPSLMEVVEATWRVNLYDAEIVRNALLNRALDVCFGTYLFLW